jgi:predicted RNase H-like HicB family nuclease
MSPEEAETVRAAAKILGSIGGDTKAERDDDQCMTCGHRRVDHINLGKPDGIWCVDLSYNCDCKRFRLDVTSRPYGRTAETLRKIADDESTGARSLHRLTYLTLIAARDPEDGGFTSYVPELPGCVSEGATPAEALSSLAEALQGVIAEGALT